MSRFKFLLVSVLVAFLLTLIIAPQPQKAHAGTNGQQMTEELVLVEVGHAEGEYQ